MPLLDGYQALITATLIFLVSLFIPKQNAVRAERVGVDPGIFGFKTIPAKIKFLVHGYSLVKRRYAESKDKNYHLQSTNVDRLILAPKYLPELRTLNTTKIDHAAAAAASTIGRYSGVDIIMKDRQSVDVCRGRLTKSIPTIIPGLVKWLCQQLEEELGDCDDKSFTPHIAHKLMLSLNTTATSLIFVGPELTQNKEWIQTFASIQPVIASVIICLTPMPRFLRSIFGPIIPPTRRLKSLHEKIRRFLFSPDSVREKSEFQTVLDHYIATSKTGNEEEIVAKFCVLSTSAMFTVSNAVTQALFDLCLMPQYVDDLRQELEDALRLNGGQWDYETLKRLKRMDSFLKESQRFHPHSYLSVDRMVMSDIQLFDGTILPKGQFISFPSGPMSMDPEYHSEPEKFDGYRFYRESSNPDEGASEFDLVGMEYGSLHWGYGKLTCPGRWYAGAVMKLMMGLILLNYDIKFPDGQTQRPPDAYLDTMIQPNEKQEILFRKRRRSRG